MPGIETIVWLVLMLLFLGTEAATVGLTSIWFAVGALAAMIAAALGAGTILEIVLFSMVSLVCLLLVRPLAKNHVNSKVQHTNADRIIGEKAVVTEEIDNLKGTGAVSVSGRIWTARSDTEGVIPRDTPVRILRIEGVKVFVRNAMEEVTV